MVSEAPFASVRQNNFANLGITIQGVAVFETFKNDEIASMASEQPNASRYLTEFFCRQVLAFSAHCRPWAIASICLSAFSKLPFVTNAAYPQSVLLHVEQRGLSLRLLQSSLVTEQLFCYLADMPRSSSFTSEQLVDRALQHFWVYGFHASSMDDLVQATGVSRHGVYTSFGGKKALFLACFEHYKNAVVTPAFKAVEAEGADLLSVLEYFETQIARGAAMGLPGPGCFVANSATEVAPGDPDVLAQVTHHNDRLKHGFAQALQNEIPALRPDKADELADVMVIFTNGLWTQSRSVSDPDDLRQTVRNFLSLLTETTK